ncbi:MAG: ABC transporter ATP-binding protein [Sulfuricellaceae bacterium]|nr:ABC transporter ATP-binding protein [Sulfuricellaceae bacterium]
MLCAEHLRVTVPGRVLCHDLNLEMNLGECWVILGRNGCGKTSLLHTLIGFQKPAGGRVVLDGVATDALPLRLAAQKMGALLQEDTPVFSGSVLEYVLLGRFPHIGSLAPGAGDIDFARQNLARMSLNPLESHSLATLSGGERQRARIAMLLTQNPQIFFLDEPLQHLDLPHQIETMKCFSQLAREQNRLVVMVLHDISWANRYCDHAILMFDEGKISQGECTSQINVRNLEELYQCRIKMLPGDSNYYLPDIE